MATENLYFPNRISILDIAQHIEHNERGKLQRRCSFVGRIITKNSFLSVIAAI